MKIDLGKYFSQVLAELPVEAAAVLLVKKLFGIGKDKSASPTISELNPFGWKDNALFVQLIASTEHNYPPATGTKSIWVILVEFRDYLWEQASAEAKNTAREVAREMIEANSQHLPVHNVEDLAKQLLMLPFISLWSTAANSPEKRSETELALYQMVSLPVPEMYQVYCLYSPQPERWLEGFKRKLLHSDVEAKNRDHAFAEKARKPGGILYELDQDWKNRR